MRVLVLGASGMLGHKLLQRLTARVETVGTVREAASTWGCHPLLRGMQLIGNVRADEFDSVSAVLSRVRPDVVINAIGIIKHRAQADDAIASIQVNALFPHRLAEVCRATGSRLIQISTDCVFSGTQGKAYSQDTIPDPPDLYGRSKLLGEVAGPGCLTLRTSIVGRELRNRTGLVEWFLSQRGKTVPGFVHALYTGLTTQVLSDLIAGLIERQVPREGVWQVASRPISKFELLELLNRSFRLNCNVQPETSFVCDRRLDGSPFAQAAGFVAPAWPEMVAELAQDPSPYEC